MGGFCTLELLVYRRVIDVKMVAGLSALEEMCWISNLQWGKGDRNLRLYD